MKSKVILFCVLLFCSKFVESIPFSEEHAIPRAYQPSNWPENQNAPVQNPNTFTRTQNLNSARQNDNIPEYYQNQGRLNDESYGYKNNPTFITPEKVNYDSYADGERLNSYQSRVDSYPPRIDEPYERFENKNWQSQNQFNNPGETGGSIFREERPLVTTVRNSYRAPVQYQPPKFTSSSSQPYYENERAYPSREQYYQEQALPGSSSSIPYVNNKDAAIITSDVKGRNSGGPRYAETLLDENYSGVPTVIADALANKFGNKQYVDDQQYRSGTVKNYNEGTSDVMYPLPDKSENKRLLDSYGSSQDTFRNFDQIPIITAPININSNDGSFMIPNTVVEESANRRYNNMDNFRSRPEAINTVPIKPINNYNAAPAVADFAGENLGNKYNNNYKDDQSDITLVDKPRINRYGPNYARQSNPAKNGPGNNYNVGPVVKVDTVVEKSGKSGIYENNYRPDSGSNKLPIVKTFNFKNDAPAIDVLVEKTAKNRRVNSGSYAVPTKSVTINKNNRAPSTLLDSVKVNPNNDKPSDSYKPQQRPINPVPADRALDQKDKNPKIQSFSFKDILSKTQIQSMSGNSKRFVIVHPNKTVEYVDKFDPRAQDSKKFRLINANQFTEAYGDSVGNGTFSTPSPANVPANSAVPVIPAVGQTLPPDSNQLDIKMNSTLLVPSKSDNPSVSTLSPTGLYNKTTPIPVLLPTTLDAKNDQQPTTYSPVGTPTPCPDNSSDIITISPIELATDYVTDVPPVTTTTTTTTESPVITTAALNTVTYAYTKQDNGTNGTNSSSIASTSDSAQTLSTTTASPSKSVPVTEDEIGSGIVIEIKTEANGTQNNKTVIVNQENNKKNGTQTATNSSLTNSDVPTTHDDYSPVTTELSIQNDVNTGDTPTTPGDNSLEYNQSETDIKVTLSKDNDSEDEIINITIEVSESTDDDESSDEDVMLVKIDTKQDKKDETKSLNTDDSKKDRSNESNKDTNKGKNVQIDLANIKGEPMVWFKTTNQDFIHKLMSKNDTSFDVMYFFDMHGKMIIEKDKHTTIFCNGTVVIDQTETTWEYENDPSPKIEKTQKIINIKDYKP